MNTQVEILVNGKPIKQYQHEGKSFIEARINTEYAIKVKNSSCVRKLAVITVDGLNVITGQPHTDNGVGEGYVINAYDAIEIRGFRKDMGSVGAFKFCQACHSYCNEKGLKGNNGVIGVRIYDEKINYTVYRTDYWRDNLGDIYPVKNIPNYPQTPYTSPNYQKITYTDNIIYCSNPSNCSTSCSNNVLRRMSVSTSAPNFDVGTTWGKEIADRVINTEFDVNKKCYTDHVIYYDVKKNLEKIGIKFIKEKEVFYPKAFGIFATPPKGWCG
jgi:hypothetical protein